MEGLRLVPALEEAKRRGQVGFPSSCKDCQKQLSAEQRVLLGCAWEPEPTDPNFRAYISPWTGCGVESRPATDDAPAFPSVCPGYTTTLPEVIEAVRARVHWDKGELTQFVHGQASDSLLTGIEILHGSVGTVQNWIIDNPVKKGGA